MSLSNAWQCVSKRWGHSFHAMGRRWATFPPRLPHYFIEKFTRPGDVVLDPFSGRGATALQACVTGRIGIGVDLDPLAYVFTKAAVDAPPLSHVEARLRALENDMFYGEPEQEPDSIRLLFHPTTLRQLVHLKQALDLDDPCDLFLAATILETLHGSRSADRNRPKHFAIPLPNTFSPLPDRIREHIRSTGLKPVSVNVFSAVRARLARLFASRPPATRGFAYRASIEDLAHLPNPHLRRRQVKLIVTSPPHPGVARHGIGDWLRLWFLNENAPASDESRAPRRTADSYPAFVCRALRRMASVLAPDGVCCLVLGDANHRADRPPASPARAIRQKLQAGRSPFQFCDLIEDRLPERRRAGAIHDKRKNCAVAADHILVLCRDSIRELTGEVNWSPPRKRRRPRQK